MTSDEWRALIEAHVAGRLSADAFKRRFLEAFEASGQERAAVPAAVQELVFTVQAYAGDPLARGHDVADDAELRRAAELALTQLPAPADTDARGAELGAASPRPQPSDPPGEAGPPHEAEIVLLPPQRYGDDKREEIPRFGGGGGGWVISLGWLGCLVALGWVALVVLQFFAIADEINHALEFPAALSTILAVPLSLFPVIGGIVAFFGAKDVWDWNPVVAAIVFLILPALTVFAGGSRARRRGPRA